MRRARRTDSNQAAIVEAMRAAGASVEVLSDVGRGVPDLLVGIRGRNLLIEVKLPSKIENDVQVAWRQEWRGLSLVVESVAQAIAALRGRRG